MRNILIFASLIFFSATPEQIHTLYNSLNPQSIPEHLAFYQLYPNTPDGNRALEQAWNLLTKNQHTPPNAKLLAQFSPAVDTLVSLITKDPASETPTLTAEELTLIETAGQHLRNRQLKGYRAEQKPKCSHYPFARN